MSQPSDRPRGKEVSPEDLLQRLERARTQLLVSSNLLKRTIDTVKHNSHTGFLPSEKPWYDLSKRAFGQPIFSACAESCQAFEGIFGELHSLKGLATHFDEQFESWDNVAVIRAGLQGARETAEQYTFLEDQIGPSNPELLKPHIVEKGPERDPGQSAVHAKTAARKRSRPPIDATDDAGDDTTPRAFKSARTDDWVRETCDPTPATGWTSEDSGQTGTSRKRAVESDEDNTHSQRATKVIRITDDTPTRKLFAAEIKKRRMAGKHRRKEHQDENYYSGPTPHSEPSAPWSEAGTPGPDDDYEDVSAEVAARLKAKEAQRVVKKGEMKRKRSGDSLANQAQGVSIRATSTQSFKRQRYAVN